MKKTRTIDEVNFLLENFTDAQIQQLENRDLLSKRVIKTLEVKRCYNKQGCHNKMDRYMHTAIELGISESYVIKLLNE